MDLKRRYELQLSQELDSSLDDLFNDKPAAKLRSARPSKRAAERQILHIRQRNSYALSREHRTNEMLLGGRETAYERYEID